MSKSFLNLSLPKKTLRYFLSHRKRGLIGIIAIIIIAFLLFPKSNPEILTEKIGKGDIEKTVSVTGDVAADTMVNLSFQTSETLGWVGVREGDSVVRGQAIASLDQTKLQASLRQAQQDFIAAKAASDQYYDSHKNATESYDEKVKRTALDATQNKAYDQLLKVQYDIAHSTLYSPIDGIVTRVDAQTPGVNITTTTVFTVTDPSSLYLKMEVDEADVGKISIGQDVKASFDSFPDKTIFLTVDSIDFVSHETSSGGNAFYVKAHLSDANSYRIGMGANADIIIDKKNGVLSISSSSIFEENYVYVLKGGKFEKRKLTLGLQSDTEAQVLSGVLEGEYVALDPMSVPQSKIIK